MITKAAVKNRAQRGKRSRRPTALKPDVILSTLTASNPDVIADRAREPAVPTAPTSAPPSASSSRGDCSAAGSAGRSSPSGYSWVSSPGCSGCFGGSPDGGCCERSPEPPSGVTAAPSRRYQSRELPHEVRQRLPVSAQRGHRHPLLGTVVPVADRAELDRRHPGVQEADGVRGTVAPHAHHVLGVMRRGRLAQALYEGRFRLHHGGRPAERGEDARVRQGP